MSRNGRRATVGSPSSPSMRAGSPFAGGDSADAKARPSSAGNDSLVEQRLGIVKRSRVRSVDGGVPADATSGGSAGAAAPPDPRLPTFDTSSKLAPSDVAAVQRLAGDVIDCLLFPDAAPKL